MRTRFRVFQKSKILTVLKIHKLFSCIPDFEQSTSKINVTIVEKNSAVHFVFTSTIGNTTKRTSPTITFVKENSTLHIFWTSILQMSTQLRSAMFVTPVWLKVCLQDTKKTHLDGKFKCEKCDNVYTRKDNLQKHQLQWWYSTVKHVERLSHRIDISNSTKELISKEWKLESMTASFVKRHTHQIRSWEITLKSTILEANCHCVKNFKCKSCGQQSQRNPSKL